MIWDLDQIRIPGVNAGKLIVAQVDGAISRSFLSSSRVLHRRLSVFLRPGAFEKPVGQAKVHWKTA